MKIRSSRYPSIILDETDWVAQDRSYVSINAGKFGLVTDVLEMEDGFPQYEITFPDDRGWYTDLDVEFIATATENEESMWRMWGDR